MAERDTFHLVIASVGETRFDGQARSATFPGSAGEMTVLAHHEPFVTTLKNGMITVKGEGNNAEEFPIEGGVLEVSGNRAVVLL
jgi:F-type H+-transporting ATPase subunit epsilon